MHRGASLLCGMGRARTPGTLRTGVVIPLPEITFAFLQGRVWLLGAGRVDPGVTRTL